MDSFAPSWTWHPGPVVSCATGRRSIIRCFNPYSSGNKSQQGEKQLWQDLLLYPSDWWDNRLDKWNPRHPDFRHKVTRESLWLNEEHVDPTSSSSQLQSGMWGVQAYTAIDYFQGLCQMGQLDEALDVLVGMGHQGVVPSVNMYTCLLKACTRKRSLAHAKRVHAHLASHGLECTRFFGENMVYTLVKCGGLEDALCVFQELPHTTVFSWTALIGGYATAGQGQEALRLYTCMLKNGVEPDRYTFVSLLTACGSVSHLEEGKRIHAEVLKYRCESDLFVCTSLVDMYAKCGSTLDAHNVFDGLSQRDVVSWNAMIAAYAQQDEADKALQLYEQMWEQGASPNDRTFVSALQACGVLAEKEEGVILAGQLIKVESLKKGKEIHADIQKKGYHSEVFVGNILISMYGKCGSIEDASLVFDGMLHPDAVSWTAILSAYVLQGQPARAFQLYAQMLEEGANADALTIVTSLQACSILAENEEEVLLDGQAMKAKSLEMGKALHADAVRKCYDSDTAVVNTLMSMYAKCGCILEARKVFDELPHRTVVSWNVLLSAYNDQGQGEKALQLYRQMVVDDLSPNEITLVCILQACSSIGSLELCQQIHHNLVSTGKHLTPPLATTLIHVYGRCASMMDAQNVFDAISLPSVVSWNALIAGYARQGSIAASLQCYDKMCLAGTTPNSITFLSLLSVCSHAGLVDKGVEYFESMSRDYGIYPDSEHFVCMVDLFGRAGCFTKIADLLSKMVMQPNLVMWLCLLGACRKHGRVMLGKQVFDCVIRLQPKHAAAYDLMCNIYADAGLWQSANEINEFRQKAGAWKKPSQSWIQHDKEVHTFHVGDCKHPHHEPLFDLIKKVSTVLKERFIVST